MSESEENQLPLLSSVEDDSYLQKTHHGSGLVWESHFVRGDPYQNVRWEKRTAKIAKSDGTVVFEQRNVEVPDFWSQTATDIVASKYFRKPFGVPDKENSARQMVERVGSTIAKWGWQDGYFAAEQDYLNFQNDLKWILINQYGAFNSPVWFNVGVYERPQCSACQPYRSLISSPLGFFKIGEIVENNLIGLPVYDSFGTTKVVAVKNNGVKKVYKIVLRNGSFIEVTGDHLVKAVHERRTKSAWIQADKLKKGMRLQLYPHRAMVKKEVVAFHQSESLFSTITIGGQVFAYPQLTLEPELKQQNFELEISEAALAGWLQADGFVGQYTKGTNQSLTMEFLTVNDQEKEWIEQHLEFVFPDVHRKTRVTKTKLGTPITRIRLYGEKLRYFVEKYELLKRREKIRVPDMMWKSRSGVVTAYLKSVFQSEGHVSTRGTSCHVAIATISENWMHDMQILLFGLGIYSRIRKKEEKRNDREDMFELDIAVGGERKKFFERIGFISDEKQRKLLASLEIEGIKNILDLREEEIVGIKELGFETVYDIQTESGEYLTNNVAVHNCFILAVEDNMNSILEWYRDEGWIFKFGSGAGTNLSKLRSSKEPLSRGGRSSGPVSFMKGADGVANSIRSGGETRRAAKMVVLNVDHPDIKDFIYCKKIIEDMTKALVRSGIKDSITADLFDPYALLPYQNANNSVRVTDEFMRAVENDDWWDLKSVTTGESLERVKAREVLRWMADAAWHSADPGMQFDTITNDWHTCPKAGRINASNPCSEYVHLDNSACNLASINLLKFLRADGSFDLDLYKKVIDTFILAQDILVDNSSYPTEGITKNARNYRELGLGYANLGALLMTMGLAYDSDRGRAIAGLLTSILTGEGYKMSAELARAGGPFRGFEKDREGMLGVIQKHYQAAENLVNGIDQSGMTEENYLKHEAVNVWREAFELGGQYGIRNSQATVLAPTGTISFLMDCATTGIEPELALVKYKKLVGGGTLKLVNPHVPSALKNLGYQEGEIDAISKHLLEKGTIEGAPGLKDEHLPVFDCSFKAANGQRSIQYMGHIKMMSAAQPFISGAISKTVNLPGEATVEEIEKAFIESWKHGLKAVAFYRDGSKSIQPLNTSDKDKELVEKINGHTRFKMPAVRPALIHKFSVGGHEGYLTVGMYPGTKKVGETFITIAKEGSTVSGLLDTIATLTSISLQSGVPLKVLVRKFKDMRFEPSGLTSNEEIPFAKSIIDYIFKFLGQNFLNEEQREEVFGVKPISTASLISSQTDALAVADTEATVCECGSIMVRAGSCFSCPNCFSTTGVCN
ncbi:MAG: ribonucleoside-diphosphate reductase alpha chain [Parcubacteria group bacterium Gr01-1014_44]|nr:MAG: ribonucleoside-diphosphate reductase alpha chain [Parcubacteria group bacterium Gr01-1014_44]